MRSNVDLVISQDEALVLFDLLARFTETGKLTLGHNSEFVALSRISAQLGKKLVEPLAANYDSLLTQARNGVAAGFEGLAPGVTGGGA